MNLPARAGYLAMSDYRLPSKKRLKSRLATRCCSAQARSRTCSVRPSPINPTSVSRKVFSRVMLAKILPSMLSPAKHIASRREGRDTLLVAPFMRMSAPVSILGAAIRPPRLRLIRCGVAVKPTWGNCVSTHSGQAALPLRGIAWSVADNAGSWRWNAGRCG